MAQNFQIENCPSDSIQKNESENGYCTHSIWDPATANVSLVFTKGNNNNESSLSSLSLKENLKLQPWYKSCDRKMAEQMLLKCKYNL